VNKEINPIENDQDERRTVRGLCRCIVIGEKKNEKIHNTQESKDPERKKEILHDDIQLKKALRRTKGFFA
jgi:hypothetical protein